VGAGKLVKLPNQGVSIVQKFANPSKIGNAKVICEAEVRVLRVNLKWKSRLVRSSLVLVLMLGIASCQQSLPATDNSIAQSNALTVTDGPLAEVNTPASILQLAPSLDKYQPEVEIISPKADEILSDDRVTVKFKVTDLPLFKHSLGLGNHLHVILDKQTYQGVYDLTQPLVFKNLTPGTHSLRVFASRPWHESFKNEGAFDRVTFHVLTKTAENNPDPQQPLLTYSRPAGTYGAEPIMLDYYLTNAPSHPVAPGSSERLPDWRVRVTVNDQRFILDRWAPVYLQGFKPGKNWVRLELVDDRGNPLPNAYNDTVGIVTYDPQMKDTLAQLILGELSPDLMQSLVDPKYAAIPAPTLPTTAPSAPAPTPTLVVPTPIVKPIPIAKTPPTPQPLPTPIVKIQPSPEPEPNRNDVAPVEAMPTKATPTIAPSPTSIVIVPVPVPEPKRSRPAVVPTPLSTPAPEIAKSSPQPEPIKVLIPAPSSPPKPTSAPAEIAIVPPQIPAPTAPQPAPQLGTQQQPPRLVNPPTMPTPTVVVTTGETWQTKTIELVNLAKTKIRAFTNTIPAKSQRFAHNLQIWAAQAIEFIEQLRQST
jgi:hypothetical protein